MPLLRVPYTDPLPPPHIIPRTAHSVSGAIAALTNFLSAPPSKHLKYPHSQNDQTVLLSGAGISVASGLADYRGTNGTYTLNRTYRPVYYNEFTANHEARKRYWARSYLGWTNLHKASPNVAHRAVTRLGELGTIRSVITQNVDSFHPTAHPDLPTIELHGYLRALVCLTCHVEYPRSAFQTQLSALNPAWASFLEEVIASGALDTENLTERRARGLRTNPDGDVDIPGAPYSTFRYPACLTCLANGTPGVHVDGDGGWIPSSTSGNSSKDTGGGVLKPAVIMFGESIPAATKTAAEEAVDAASRILVIGSSLATYSAWRLVKRASENGMPIGVVNIGGVRGEETFFGHVGEESEGREGLRVSVDVGEVLPRVLEALEEGRGMRGWRAREERRLGGVA